MSRRDLQRLDDIATAISAIRKYLREGDLLEPVVFDAVRMRLVELGEAANAISPDVKARELDIPWGQISGMRNRLTHRYFDNEIDIIRMTVERDLQPLGDAVARLQAILIA